MTWTPINLNDVARRLNIEILRAATNEDIHSRRDSDSLIYCYDHEAGDYQFDGSDVTEEVSYLILDGLLRGCRDGSVQITDAGRAYLAEGDA